ncbi:hypothetical protein BV372_27105 [Nostoc sp. T09]|uniref:hypothetical protein n=1 Tax=Nostoc sp. T09 TaxID=1932621 RepID=UPI000A3CC512|nr:hypothetical protein [Nostoc sp. T09]OUL26237.1 hypothetical protein BV372_27105 [Nostoc sp. T09]
MPDDNEELIRAIKDLNSTVRSGFVLVSNIIFLTASCIAVATSNISPFNLFSIGFVFLIIKMIGWFASER